ncbi:hypothetical protein I4U23_011239 [Adineta vaga]|nr:hypothetical protein I4U23_011239 [Adineta vaga]
MFPTYTKSHTSTLTFLLYCQIQIKCGDKLAAGSSVGKESIALIIAEFPELVKQLNNTVKVFGIGSAEIISKVLSELVKQLPYTAKLSGSDAIEVILRDPYIKLFLVTLTIYQAYKTLLIIQQLDYNTLRRNMQKFVFYPVISTAHKKYKAAAQTALREYNIALTDCFTRLTTNTTTDASDYALDYGYDDNDYNIGPGCIHRYDRCTASDAVCCQYPDSDYGSINFVCSYFPFDDFPLCGTGLDPYRLCRWYGKVRS